MIKSFKATPVASESANPVVVVIAIPVEKFIPAGNGALAPDKGGITVLKYTAAPAVGVPALL